MREVEATFRDASEMTNTRAVWWSLVQVGVLVGAAALQMRYLKVGRRAVVPSAQSEDPTLFFESCCEAELIPELLCREKAPVEFLLALTKCIYARYIQAQSMLDPVSSI